MKNLAERISELNQAYNDLGEDLIFLEAILHTGRQADDFPQSLIDSSILRTASYIEQHTEAINQISQYFTAF